MKAWLEKLKRGEQLALVLGALSVIALLLYSFYWQPMNAEQERLRERLITQVEALEWMQQAAQEVRQLRGEELPAPQQRRDESLLALVDRTARATVANGIHRLEPDGEHAVKVWLKDAKFDRVVPWLGELQSSWGVQANIVSLHRAEQPGVVTGRLVLEETAK